MGSGAVVAADQAPEPGGPFQAAFNDIAIPAEAGRRFDPFAGDARDDVALAERLSAVPVVVALVAVQLDRRFRGRPTGWRTDAMPSTMSSSSRWSLRLAADMSACSGSPLRSLIAWILDPGLPRSTGLGPVRFPL